MRVNNVFSGRPALYDRNPLQVTQSYVANNAPHATTTRWTYTVPSGRKASIDNTFEQVEREVAATTANDALTMMTMTPSGRANSFMSIADTSSNTLLVFAMTVATQRGFLLAGDALIGKTEDLSTGGQCQEVITAKLTEFDA